MTVSFFELKLNSILVFSTSRSEFPEACGFHAFKLASTRYGVILNCGSNVALRATYSLTLTCGHETDGLLVVLRIEALWKAWEVD